MKIKYSEKDGEPNLKTTKSELHISGPEETSSQLCHIKGRAFGRPVVCCESSSIIPISEGEHEQWGTAKT